MDKNNVSHLQTAPSGPATHPGNGGGNGGGIESRLARLEARMEYVATKEDIQKLATKIAERETSIKEDIQKLATKIAEKESSSKEDIQKLATQIAEKETSMLKWIIGTTLTAMGALFMAGVAVIRLFF